MRASLKFNFFELSLAGLIFLCGFLQEGVYGGNGLKINEIMYNPKGTDLGKEWIELYNFSEEEIQLKGFSIEIAGAEWKEVVKIEKDWSLEKGEMGTVCEEGLSGCKYYVSKIGMQNGGDATDGVRIKDSFGNVVDTALYDAPNLNSLQNDKGEIEKDENCVDIKSSEDFSLGRINDGADSDNSFSDFRLFLGGTLGISNKVTDFTDKAKFSEVLPFKDDGFIEISFLDIEFENWYVKNGENEKVYLDETILLKNDDALITYGYPFENKRDSCILLYSPEDKLEDSFCYEISYKEFSFCREKDSVFEDNAIFQYCIKTVSKEDNIQIQYGKASIDQIDPVIVKIEAKMLYVQNGELFLETTNMDYTSEIFRIKKDSVINFFELKNDRTYIIEGIWNNYSITSSSKNKYELFPLEINEKSLIEEEKLATSGERIFEIIIFCILAVFLIEYQHSLIFYKINLCLKKVIKGHRKRALVLYLREKN